MAITIGYPTVNLEWICWHKGTEIGLVRAYMPTLNQDAVDVTEMDARRLFKLHHLRLWVSGKIKTAETLALGDEIHLFLSTSDYSLEFKAHITDCFCTMPAPLRRMPASRMNHSESTLVNVRGEIYEWLDGCWIPSTQDPIYEYRSIEGVEFVEFGLSLP